MTYHEPPFDPILDPLLERGRIVPPVPDVVRARSLARARATVAAALPRPLEPMPGRWRRVLPLALAASAALAVGTAGAVVALRDPTPQSIAPTPPARPALPPPVRAAWSPPAPVPTLDSPPAAPAVAPPSETTATPRRSPRPASAQESYAAELELLQRAQAAYASQNFSGALALVAEHDRRFPSGRLAEEREALRVRSLASSGRNDEAARAAAAFASRFPRSVLLPHLGRRP